MLCGLLFSNLVRFYFYDSYCVRFVWLVSGERVLLHYPGGSSRRDGCGALAAIRHRSGCRLRRMLPELFADGKLYIRRAEDINPRALDNVFR